MQAKNEALSSRVSDDQATTFTATPDELSGVQFNGGRVPSTKRRRTFSRNVERAKKAIVAGEIKPAARPVATLCHCANRTALSILCELTEQGVIVRNGRCWKVA